MYVIKCVYVYIYIHLNYVVIEAQIPRQEDLREKSSIIFPADITNSSTNVTSIFGNMTPMIEIPSTIVLRQIEEGTCTYVYVSVCTTIHYYGLHCLYC